MNKVNHFSNKFFSDQHNRIIFLILITLTLIGFSIFKNFDFESIDAIKNVKNSSLTSPVLLDDQKKWAYVFYVTSSDYSCYAIINIHRLINDLKSDPKIDILILATKSSRITRFCPNFECPFPSDRVKIRNISKNIVKIGQSLTNNFYYMDSYVRLEAFGLYDEYDRLIILDSDGFLLRNIDHLFSIDLGEYQVAAALAYYLDRPWISSVLLVVEPTKIFYQRLKIFLTPENIQNVSDFSDGAHYDMDILNYVLDAGNRTRRLSKYYALLDSYFFEDDAFRRRRENELNRTYYVHFTMRKPLMYLETRPWPLEMNTMNFSNLETRTFENFRERIYFPFWTAFDRYCRALVQRIPTIPPAETDPGVSYPDPDSVMEFINNSSDLIIIH